MTTVYVSSEYLSQVSRIRNLLRFYRENFLALSYIDGTGNYVESAYDIWINLCLITSKVRPAFLVQCVDYMDPEVYQKIMRLLVHYRDNLTASLQPGSPMGIIGDVDYRLLFLTDPQGIIVTTYYTYYKNGLCDLYARYIRSHDDLSLALILGYPYDTFRVSRRLETISLEVVGGENIVQSGDKEYIEPQANKMHRYHERISDYKQGDASHLLGRHIFTIYAITYGSGSREIMRNIYTTIESRNRLNDFLIKIIETVKLYDSDTKILVSDTQQITDKRISKDNIYIERQRLKSKVSSSDIKCRDDFIKSSDREKENWNTEFDRIFELGYIYNR